MDINRNIREFIPDILEAAYNSMLGALHKANPELPETLHLRVNFFMPVNERLKLLFSYNMQEDPDRNIELGFRSGAVGRCWQTHDVVICDLKQAKETYETEWNMTEAQQKLVRPTLKSLLCIPIFDREHYDPNRSDLQNPLLGILTFDSDNDLLVEFASPEVQQDARISASILARAFRGRL